MDILERLRWLRNDKQSKEELPAGIFKMAEQAADEIERLRAALDDAKPFLEAYEPSDTEFGRQMSAQRDRALAALGPEQGREPVDPTRLQTRPSDQLGH